MNKLPVELILVNMIKMTENDLNKYKMMDKRIYSIYKENEEYIYTQKIKKEFVCIENPKDLYLILKKTPDNIIQIACRNNFKRVIPCNDLHKYITDIISESYKYTPTIQTLLFIEMYTNIFNCFNDSSLFLRKSFVEIIRDNIKKINLQIKRKQDTSISKELKSKWQKFYETKLSRLLVMIDDRLKTL